MTSLSFVTANVINLIDEQVVSVTGKNGFSPLAGIVPLLVNTSPEKIDAGGSTSNIRFTVQNLNDVFDFNYGKHVLDVIDGSFQGLKGIKKVFVPVIDKSSTGAIGEGFVGFNLDRSDIPFDVVSFDLVNNFIKIDNTVNEGTELLDVLPDAPFYVRIAQVIDPRFFSSGWLYVEGFSRSVEKISNVISLIGTTANFNLGVIPKDKAFISVFLDEVSLGQSSFEHINNSNQISITIPQNTTVLRTLVSDYTVPVIEVDDNISIFTDNIYSITDTTYSTDSTSYNAAITANSIFRIQLGETLKANIFGTRITNITNDILLGQLGNINVSNNTFTVDYSNVEYPGRYSLANHKVYSLSTTLGFNTVDLSSTRVISDVPNRVNFVRARSVNSIGKKSPFTTKSIRFKNYLISKVLDLDLSESLYKDTTLGIVVNIEVSFTPLVGQEVTEYEIAYKLTGENISTLSSINSVLIPASSIDTDGKIRYNITNIERGRTNSVNSILVQITPISSTNRRGIVASKTKSIIGKTAAPQNIINIAGGQVGSNLLFTWDLPVNNDGTKIDIDLLETEIRRARGIISESDFATEWTSAKTIDFVAAPSTSVILPISFYGTFTYLFRTKDTSFNISSGIAGLFLTTTRPVTDLVYRAYSEDDPSTNVVSFVLNDNATENNYPSFNDSNNFGISEVFTGPVDNANGTSDGFALLGDVTDLFAGANANYQAQIRDVGINVNGTILSSIEGFQLSRVTFNDLRSNLDSRISEDGTTNTIIVDTSNGGIGNFFTSNTATYNVSNKTLISGGASGNVYAIWNNGQMANDASNANSFALIAGVVNSDAIVLGNTYFANGRITGGNTIANLSIGNTFQIVDLSQFDDESDSLFFEGKDKVVSITEWVRTSLTDPFYANGNVNANIFITTETDNAGWRQLSPVEKSFRWFQLKYVIENQDPQQADYSVDVMNYTVELKKKTFISTVNVSSNVVVVNYEAQGFLEIPNITITPDTSESIIGTFTNATLTNAEVRTFYSSNAEPITGVFVSFKAEGI